jgi:hypothetical protein
MRGVSAATKLAPAAVVALALIVAPAASAKTAHYEGEGVDLKAGQTRGLPILIGFDLKGRGCPSGPHCFDHASVSKFEAVSWAFPDCPEVLDSAFDFPRSTRVSKRAPHTFDESGVSEGLGSYQVTIEGRFLRHGKAAKGSFTAAESPCSTGTVHWTAQLE